MSELAINLRIAWREIREGLSGFRIFLGCLILGVAAIAGVGSLSNALRAGLEQEGRAILGGDVEIKVDAAPATEDQIATFEAAGDMVRTIRFRGIARAPETGERTLVEVKAVGDAYPLYGTLGLEPAVAREEVFAREGDLWGTAIPDNLASRLGVDVGSVLELGEARFEVRALLTNEPDQSNDGFQLGPTFMLSLAALPGTDLLQEGSLVSYHYKIRMPAQTTMGEIEAFAAGLEEEYPAETWRVRDRASGAPGLRRFIERMDMFLTLVGLSALVVGGVGIGNAVRAYMARKQNVIATLKILGATGNSIFAIYVLQIMLLAVLGILIGLAIGVFVPVLLAEILAARLPVPLAFGIYPQPVLLAAVYGFLVTLAFTLWPLARAKAVPPAVLFRDLVAGEARRPEGKWIALIALAAVLIIALAIGLSEDAEFSAGFAVGAVASLLLLRGAGWLIARVARALPHVRRPGLRLAIANMHRPGAATGPVVLSLGLGLTLFAAIILVEGNLARQVNSQIPDQAPAFFLLDIRKSEIDQFRAMTADLDGITDVRVEANLRGHITAVRGIPAHEYLDSPAVTGSRWVLRGDRGLTYSGAVPEGNSIVEGDWWPADYSGPPLISFAAEEARELGISIGDTIAFSVLGREITATVDNIRELDWGTFGFNFVVVFSPGVLEAAPHTYMASLAVRDAREAAVHRAITDAFPTVTAVRIKEILGTLNDMLGDIGLAIRATAVVAIIAGILVLAGALAAGHKARVYDAAVLKTVGALRRDVLKAFLAEYAILGLVAGAIALLLGGTAGWVVVDRVMELDFTMLPGLMAGTVAASILITVGFGLLGTWTALGARPAQLLREA